MYFCLIRQEKGNSQPQHTQVQVRKIIQEKGRFNGAKWQFKITGKASNPVFEDSISLIQRVTSADAPCFTITYNIVPVYFVPKSFKAIFVYIRYLLKLIKIQNNLPLYKICEGLKKLNSTKSTFFFCFKLTRVLERSG